jgi:hypothetical protein
MLRSFVITTAAALSLGAVAQEPTPPIGSAEAVLAAPLPAEGERSSEAQALVTLITGLQAGAVDYARLTGPAAAFVRPQQATLAASLKAKGELQTIEDKGRQPNGLRLFTVGFAHDSTDFGVELDAEGRITGLTIAD